MNWTFYDGHDELYHHAKFGEDRTMRAGCRCENVFFFVFVFGLSRFESGAPFEGCTVQVRTSIALPFIVRFRQGLKRLFFSQGIALLDAVHSSHLRR